MTAKPKRRNDKNDETGDGQPTRACIIQIFGDLKRKAQDYCSCSKNKETERQRYERILATWTRRLGLFTLGLLIVAGWTARILEKADETNRITQRPYVVTPNITMTNDGVLYWFFQMALQNSGGTPTQNASVTVGMVAASPVFGAPADPLETLKPGPDSPVYWLPIVTLWPRASAPIYQFGLPQSHIDQVAKDHKQLYVAGFVRYGDEFEASPTHLTKFCFALDAYTQDGKAHPSYFLCTHWNCGDSDCDADKREYEKQLAEANQLSR